jgi:mercuric reductase
VSTTAEAGFAEGETIALRPGLSLPDWSVLRDPAGRAALTASMTVAGRREKWAGLDATEGALHRAVLRHLATSGSAPTVAQLAAATSLPEAEARAALQSLRRRDLLVLDAAGDNVISCYPFSAKPTPHLLRSEGAAASVHALCAIDALGAGGMLRADAEVSSRCAHCGAPVTIRTCGGGRAVASIEPEGAVVWSGTRYAGGCAASSGCTMKIFFCSDAHLQAWREAADPGGPGFRLTVPAAMEVALALFGPMLV